jgi:hypothetical protein
MIIIIIIVVVRTDSYYPFGIFKLFLGTQATGRRRTMQKHTTQHITDSTKKSGRTLVLAMGKQFLFLLRHALCYSVLLIISSYFAGMIIIIIIVVVRAVTGSLKQGRQWKSET